MHPIDGVDEHDGLGPRVVALTGDFLPQFEETVGDFEPEPAEQVGAAMPHVRRTRTDASALPIDDASNPTAAPQHVAWMEVAVDEEAFRIEARSVEDLERPVPEPLVAEPPRRFP
jgi:hypothetical protein